MDVANNVTPMKIAIPLCRGRIAPLFEVAESFLLINALAPDNSGAMSHAPSSTATEKCSWLAEHGVTILLCGALSGSLEHFLRQLGIEVHAFLAGDVHDLLESFLLEGHSGLARYAMPGRRAWFPGQNRHRRRRRHCDFDQFIKE